MNRRPAFTLVELMVSIALAVLLIFGVNEVFRLTGQTIAASNALSDAIRDNRGLQGSLTADTHAAKVEDAPFFIIRSERVYAYRNQLDKDNDRDGNIATADLNGDGAEENLRPTTYNLRNHRIDVLSFFTSDFQKRQTGDDFRYVSPTTSYEAYVNYGHMKVRNNEPDTSQELSATYPEPGDDPATTNRPNPNNYFASQWLLGRSQILLGDPARSGETQYTPFSTTNRFAPVGRDSRANVQHPSGSRTFLVQENRFDIAEGSMNDFRRKLLQSNYTDDEWRTYFAYRFWSNPFTLKPLNSRQVSQASNIFLKGCTQFIVEYAGDFLDQSGATDQFGRDGFVDYVKTGTAAIPQKRIRWYGGFRDVGGPQGPFPDGAINPAFDVVPLSRYVSVPEASDFFQPWEIVVPQNPTTPNQNYVAAWRPRSLDRTNPDPYRPQMIRITVTIDEPTGKLTEGQVYEYIYKLGY